MRVYKEQLENINVKQLDSIQESLTLTADAKNKKRVVYEEKDKQEMAKYAAVCGVTAAIRKFKQKFPNLNESKVRPWVKKKVQGNSQSKEI